MFCLLEKPFHCIVCFSIEFASVVGLPSDAAIVDNNRKRDHDAQNATQLIIVTMMMMIMN